MVGKFYVKALSTLSGINLKRTIIVDDNLYSFALNPENGYLIKTFNKINGWDGELALLEKRLLNLLNVEDVRTVLRQELWSVICSHRGLRNLD